MMSKQKWHEHIYYLMLWGTYFLYIVAYTGIMHFDPKYLDFLDNGVKVYVSLILMIRFNPFVSLTTMTLFDKEIAWTAGVFLFISSMATNIAKLYMFHFV